MPVTDDDLPEDYDALKAAFIEMRAKVFGAERSEEHTSELQSLLGISYAVFFGERRDRKSVV